MKKIEIIDALPDHVNEIYDLYNRFKKEHTYLEGMGSSDDIEKIMNDFKNLGGFWKLLYVNKVLVGIIIYRILSNGNCGIWDIGILKAYQNLGYGKLLINLAIEYARNNECYWIDLYVHINNSNAIKFYEKLNFKVDITNKSNDMVRMYLEL